MPAYYHILKRWDENLLFIDGFAGRGTYTKKVSGEIYYGSPLRALKLIADNKDLAKQVGTFFIEADAGLFAQLQNAVADFYKTHPEIKEPYCIEGNFSDSVQELLKAVEGKLAPTFLFVDRCGVTGTCFETIDAVMKCNKCEVFIFFNIDGVRRIAGLDKLSPVLIELMGSTERARSLYDELRDIAEASDREQLIVSHYRAALVGIGAEYTIPFRVEHEGKKKTSHYLIHATKHPLGFKIMKDVMWRRGEANDQTGGLELSQSSRTNFVPLFDNRGDTIKAMITAELKKGKRKVDLFCDDWVQRATDMIAEPAYKKALLEMEEDGVINVLAKDGVTPKPLLLRPRPKGKATLGSGHYVQLTAK